MFNVHQPWDPLKVCVVGRSYPPEFYSWIQSIRLRKLFERIAIETEEDYQFLIKTLERFGVRIIRPNAPGTLIDDYLTTSNRVPGPISMNPRDQMIMIGDKFYVYPYDWIAIKTSGRNIPSIAGWTEKIYQQIRGVDWPKEFMPFQDLPDWIQHEIRTLHKGVQFDEGEDHAEISKKGSMYDWWAPILHEVKQNQNQIITNLDEHMLDQIPANGITRIGKDLYFGAGPLQKIPTQLIAKKYFTDYRCHWIITDGHIDGCFSPVKPGLIVSIKDITTYAHTFPDWEVVYLPGESWSKMQPFLDLKKKNQGRWWIKGCEYDDELIEYVETWLRDWTGYVEESVFDVNILSIDEKNVIVNGYNKKAFDAFKRHGINPHICPIRHRYFWDGGVHCVTLDLHRDGQIKDYFPERQLQ